MEKFIAKAKDARQAQALLQGVMDSDFDLMKDLLEAGAECGLTRAEVDPLALVMDGANTHMFEMLNLHGMEQPLNASLYIAAFKGDARAVSHLLAHSPVDAASLNIALYGAVASSAENIVATLLREGAEANCGDCVALSVTIKRGDITKMLLEAGGSPSSALAAYLDNGRTDPVIHLLASGADPACGLEAICRQLSEFSAARNRRRERDYTDAFELILSYAEGFGADVPQLVDSTMSYAIQLGAVGVINKILDQPAFQALPQRSAHLDAALSVLAEAAERRLDFDVRDRCEALCERLLERGADPQAGLEIGAAAGSLAVVAMALDLGADPRRRNRKALRVSEARDTTKLLSAAEQRFDARDFEAFEAGSSLTVSRLAQPIEGSDRDGLSVLAAAAKFPEALAALQRENQVLTASALLRENKDGTCALDLICARGQAGLLMDPSLWQLRETEYMQVYDKMPEETRTAMADRHAETCARLQSCRTATILRQQADVHRKRLRLK